MNIIPTVSFNHNIYTRQTTQAVEVKVSSTTSSGQVIPAKSTVNM